MSSCADTCTAMRPNAEGGEEERDKDGEGNMY
jgi:hypothetical protein